MSLESYEATFYHLLLSFYLKQKFTDIVDYHSSFNLSLYQKRTLMNYLFFTSILNYVSYGLCYYLESWKMTMAVNFNFILS